jgi:periplasmic protein TonB
MNGTFSLQQFATQTTPGWNARAIVLISVLACHGLAFAWWSQQKEYELARPGRMEISFEAIQQQMTEPQHQAKMMAKPVQQQISPVPEPVLPVQAEAPVRVAPVAAAPAQVAPAVVAAAAPVAITEPDYKASYLNNPPPVYPLAARRMGMQGRVLLHVEVLASGVSGQVAVQQSSGYAMLDNAALQAVRSWRFQPATQAGQAVDKWFMIPVQFSLKESAA